MSKKNQKFTFYSTNPDAQNTEWDEDETIETLPVQQQKLRVTLDRKLRKGKDVTLITGFVGTDEDLSDLGKILKTKCGVGGSSKANEIILQGNLVLKVVELLKEMGYNQTKRIGG